jgi:hypothetical protein
MRILPALLVLLACSRPQTFSPYAPDTKEFSVDAPDGWERDERGLFSKTPIAETQWTGAVVDESEGYQVGAAVSIRRISRLKKNIPAADYARFKKGVLDQGDRILAGRAGVPVEKNERGFFVYRRQWDQSLGGGLHGPVRTLPMGTETHILRTPANDYILEYRAVRQLYEKHYPVFQRLAASFKLAK